MNVHVRGGVIQIDKGIPLVRSKYPFAKMEVGDSFFTTVPVKTIHSAIYRQNGKGGSQFTYQKCTENGTHGVRIWRIA